RSGRQSQKACRGDRPARGGVYPAGRTRSPGPHLKKKPPRRAASQFRQRKLALRLDPEVVRAVLVLPPWIVVPITRCGRIGIAIVVAVRLVQIAGRISMGRFAIVSVIAAVIGGAGDRRACNRAYAEADRGCIAAVPRFTWRRSRKRERASQRRCCGV